MTPSRTSFALSSSTVLVRWGLSTQYRQLAGLFLLGAAATLMAFSVHAQTAESVGVPAPQETSPSRVAPPEEPAKTTASKYSARDIDRAFSYMDANRDGKVSRDEASGFKNVAKYFDLADTDKDSMLTRDEFARALNRRKPDAAAQAASKQ